MTEDGEEEGTNENKNQKQMGKDERQGVYGDEVEGVLQGVLGRQELSHPPLLPHEPRETETLT